MLIDLSGHLSVLTPEWESEDGLAWSPDGKEVWFTAVEKGLNRDLHAVSMSGRIRKILDLPEGMTLQDMAPDGRVLVSLDHERLRDGNFRTKRQAADLSWHDWNIAKDISSDGQSILFEDASEAAGPHYSLAIRKIDGTPPVQLGEGSAGGLSPDGKWAISILPGSPGQVKLVPVGPGQPRMIATPGWSTFKTALLISWQTENTSPSTPANPATACAVTCRSGREESQRQSRRKGSPAG